MESFRMFDFVRKHTKIMMFVMFLLIIPSFVLFGIDRYSRMSEKGVAVARVGGQDIGQAEWDSAHKAETDRIRASMPSVDPKLLDSPEARFAVLERLVRERVMMEAADKLKLVTSDARLARELQQDATIASLRRPDGSMDMERYRQLVASQGLTPEGYEARVRRDIALSQVDAGVTGSGFAVPALADVALNAFFETREIQLARFTAADFAVKISPSDADLETFYKGNPALFQAVEAANIEYVVLDLDAVKKNITINEADLKAYYEQNVARLSGTEERRASHILITAAKDAPAADREKARARAQELLLAVRQAPGSFAEVAKNNSQDPGSAKAGGDLNFFARGAMVKPFEDAAFALKKGEISEVIASDFGFHIIQLTDIKSPKQRSFEELRASIESDLKTQQASAKFAESAEAFTNGVYEQSDSLKPVAERLKLEVKTATGVARKPDTATTGVLANAKFLNAIFNPDAIEKKRNTEAVETGPSQLAAGRVTQYTPAQTRPFAEVRDVVLAKVIAIRAAELAKKEGQEKLVAWKAAPASAAMPAAVVVSRVQPQNVPSVVLDVAMRTDTSSLPQFAGVDLGAQGYAIVKINAVVARPVQAEAAAKQDRAQYSQWWTQAESLAYYNVLKERFKGQIKVTRPVRASGVLSATSPQ
jgi:peptidyl-prolyl cis-trans isomerase D